MFYIRHMSEDAITIMTFRLPASLREKIKTQAGLEDRSESAFVRFHIGKVVSATDEECSLDEPEGSVK